MNNELFSFDDLSEDAKQNAIREAGEIYTIDELEIILQAIWFDQEGNIMDYTAERMQDFDINEPKNDN